MNYRIGILCAILVSIAGCAIRSHAAAPKVQILHGNCGPSSNTAEGPLDSDLTKRQSRFYCDTASITSFEGHNGHVLVDFSQKESKHSPVIGFAGTITSDGVTSADGLLIQIHNVYLGGGEATTVGEGSCKFFFKKHQLSGIGCGMKVDEAGRRTVAMVTFDANPGQSFELKADLDASADKSGSNKREIGIDGMTGGSPDDIWQKVQSDGREIYVMTTGRYFTTNPPLSTVESPSGYGFVTNIVANLPESTIVGAPESVMNIVSGNFQTRHYSVLGYLFFAGKNRSGFPMQSAPPENFERKLVPDSPLEKAFNMLCKIAEKQN